MSDRTGKNRWWENYLVRYLMPSIAGTAIVSWLVSSDSNLSKILIFGHSVDENSTTSLAFLFMYGNLFCYIASYPILVFHTTRVLDFKAGEWKHHLLDGYILTLGLMGFTIIAYYLPYCPLEHWQRVSVAYFIVGIFSFLQLIRLAQALKHIPGHNKKYPYTSLAYAYMLRLALRRSPDEVKNTSADASEWRHDLVQSYRHVREHGNSAFIFVLEIVLAILCRLILSVSDSSIDASERLALIGCLLMLWSIPAMFVHLLGQSLEYRFSHFKK